MARFQQTLASQLSFAKYGRKSKRELFLEQMNLGNLCTSPQAASLLIKL
jgi:hypothetical protein